MPKLWAANLLSRQLPPISYFAFIVGECRYADLPIGPSEGLCPCRTVSVASLSFVLLPLRILCNAGLSTTSFSRSSCASSSSASLQEDKKTANLLVRIGQQ